MAESTPTLTRTKHAGIFRKDNRFQVRYRHNGRQVAKSFRTLSEARRFKSGVDLGDTQPTSSRTFRSYAEGWIESYSGRTAKGISDSTRASYRDALERFAIPFFGTRALDRIDAPTIKLYVAHLAEHGHSPASVRRYYAPVRALLATAFEDGLIRSNPAAGVRVVVEDSRPRVPKWLSAEQTKMLLAEIPAEHADLVFLLASTGLRISEALALRWADLTVEDGRPCLTVTRSKTSAGERTIPLSPEAARRLMRRQASSGEGLVFPSITGSTIDARNFRRRVFAPAAVRAGVPWATPHKLRHGMASLMASQGLGAAQIAAHLGHADGGVLALRTYIHPSLAAVDFVDAAFTD